MTPDEQKFVNGIHEAKRRGQGKYLSIVALMVFLLEEQGDTAIVCDPTDGEEYDRCPLSDLTVYGVVTGIVRSLEAEERPDMGAWDEFRAKYPADRMETYYPSSWRYATAIKQHERGGGYGCFSWGYSYGFAEGRRAEKNADRRERRAKQRKGAV